MADSKPRVAWSFDPTTVENIAKGALHAFLNAAFISGALAALDYLSHVQVANPTIAGLFAFLIPTAYNAVKEFSAGDPAPPAGQ